MRKTYLEWVEIVNNLAYDEVLVDMLSDWQADGLFRTDCINKLEARIAELEAGLISAGKQQGLYLQELMDLRAAQRWIPVSEKPKVDGRYLLRNIYDDIYPAKFVAESESWMLGRYDTITHWMPLPTPPEVQE